MELRNQVCSLELAKRLKELGVKQKSLWVWNESRSKSNVKWKVFPQVIIDADNECSAFTVAELGEMLPTNSHSERLIRNNKWHCSNYFIDNCDFEADSEADSRAEMLIHLIEKRIIKP